MLLISCVLWKWSHSEIGCKDNEMYHNGLQDTEIAHTLENRYTADAQ